MLFLLSFAILVTPLSSQQTRNLNEDGAPTGKRKSSTLKTVITKGSDQYLFVFQNLKGDTLKTITSSSMDSINRNGITKLFYINGTVQYSKSYTNNKLNGTTIRYYDNGKRMSVVELQKDSITNKKSYSQEGTEIKYIEDEIHPTFENKNIDAFRTYLCDNVRYPVEALEKNQTGKYTVQFIVTETGKIDDIRISGGRDPSIIKDIIRVTKKSETKWKAGYRFGEPMNVKYSYYINYYGR
jgi:hypothetical protein